MNRSLNLTPEEIKIAFEGVPPILSPQQLSEVLGFKSVKTVYAWMSAGRLDGSYRKRGKHALIWRDRAIDAIFNGKNWSN